MTLEQARKLLAVYVVGELDAPSNAELVPLLGQHPELRAELERWRALRACVQRVVNAPAVPNELPGRVCQRLVGRPRRQYRLRYAATLTAVAALVALVVAVWPSMSRAMPTVVADDFARVHLRCGVQRRHRGVKVDLGHIGHLRTTLAELAQYPVLVSDLAPLGCRIDGVCRCFHPAGDEGPHGVHVFYRTEDAEPKVVSLFSVDRQVCLADCERHHEHTTTYRLGRAGEVWVRVWDEGFNSYAVCGRMDPAGLKRVADRVRLALRTGRTLRLAQVTGGVVR